MQIVERTVHRRQDWGRKVPLAVAATLLLAASAAPAAAFYETAWPHGTRTHHVGPPPSHHHFYRSAPHHAFMPGGMTAMAGPQQDMEQDIAYCSARFRSYDPSTGTYLGYDGREHACP